MSKIENDPDLKQQQKILAHKAPGKPPHGMIRKAKPWHLAMVHNPKKKP